MLAALAVLREERGFSLYGLHVEHGIRTVEESRGDAEAVRERCKCLDVPCKVVSIAPGKIAETAKSTGLGIEGAARFFRHRAWNREARRIGAARVLVAHTQEDLLETVVMRFLRGAGPAGLAAMPRERGMVLRPLLGLTRSEVLGYLEAQGIPFRTDSTNRDIRYLRNRIRHKLIPCLDELFPQWKKTVLALAETQRLTADFLEAETRERVHWEWDEGKQVYRTGEMVFFAQPSLIRQEALFQAADQLVDRFPERALPDPSSGSPGGSTIRRASLRRFAAGELSAIDLGPVRIERQGTFVIVSAPQRVYDGGFARLIKTPGIYTLKELTIEVTALVTEKGLQQGAGDFFARLPLVLRSYRQDVHTGLDEKRLSQYTNSIVAEDMNGPAAVLCSDEKDMMILLCREEDGNFLFHSFRGY
jgi:tRNA(Ile)-lysidine synthase